MPRVVTPEVLGRAFADAPDPELARVAVSRLGERAVARDALERPEVLHAATRLLGYSTAAVDFYAAHPEELASLADISRRSPGQLRPEAAADVAAFGASPGVRRFRRRAAYRIAARDLLGTDVDEVMLELTDLADVCLDLATRQAGHEGLAIVGMGKLGGRELNYSSDVDVLFVHRDPGRETQAAAGRAAAAVVTLLSEPTTEGVAFRVDVDLRPGGRAAPLSRSLDAMLDHYANSAATWERQALLKARPVAGDVELAAELVERLNPLVYAAVLPATALEEIRSTKLRIEELVRSRGKEASELKRGRGGIRDVEFSVQLLQLVHGRRYPSLRVPGTLPALAALAEDGFVRAADATALADSYRFLRRLEHRLQMVRDLQTHELPADRVALTKIARAMGLRDATELQAEHARHAVAVRTLHERLFYRPLLEAFAGGDASAATERLPTEELLAGLGFADPSSAYLSLSRIVDRRTRLGKVLETMFPVVAPALAFAAQPDVALRRFERVVEALRDEPDVADAFADSPDAVRRLTSLVAASSAFADTLVARPASVHALFRPPAAEPQLFAVDPDVELVRVAGAYAAAEVDVPELGYRLAAAADAAVASAVRAAGDGPPIAVVAMGRLGAQEPTFASDLDLVFVHEGEGAAAFAAAEAVAERTMTAIRTSGWEPDADLRPEGRSGPLTRSLASYLEYWQRWAQTWEYQALLRARFVAGDEALGRRFLANAADVAYPSRLTKEQVIAIRRMRVRIEEERVRPPDSRRVHLKLGYGSLADVAFAVELSLMRHGDAHPEVRHTNTLLAIAALADAGVFDATTADALRTAQVFLLRVKNAMEIERRIAASALPPTPEAQTVLARRLGSANRHVFLQEYRRVTRRARWAMERVFYAEER